MACFFFVIFYVMFYLGSKSNPLLPPRLCPISWPSSLPSKPSKRLRRWVWGKNTGPYLKKTRFGQRKNRSKPVVCRVKNLLVKGKIDPATCGPRWGWHFFDPGEGETQDQRWRHRLGLGGCFGALVDSGFCELLGMCVFFFFVSLWALLRYIIISPFEDLFIKKISFGFLIKTNPRRFEQKHVLKN